MMRKETQGFGQIRQPGRRLFICGLSIRSFQEKSDQLAACTFIIRLVTHGQVYPCFLVHYAFGVGKYIKSGFSVVGTHAAFAHSAERQMAGCQVDYHIIDASAAVGEAGSNIFNKPLVLSKDIKGKGFWFICKQVIHLVNISVSQYRQDGAEDLFLHYRVIPCDIFHYCRFDLKGAAVILSAADNFCRVDEAQYTVKMFFVYDLTVVTGP